MLEFEVIPEVSLRNEFIEFILGMPLCQAINGIQKSSRSIKSVELLYNQEDPLAQDIVISLTQDGVRLFFDARCQRLKVIEVYDLNKITLRYCSTIFSSPSEKASIQRIDQSFGATHPGVYDASQQLFILSWRGLSFAFPAEPNVQANPHYAHGLSSLQFPNGSSPVVSKLFIYSGNNLTDAKAPEMPLYCFNGNCHVESVDVLRRRGRTLGIVVKTLIESVGAGRFPDIQKDVFERTVLLGDTCEDVLSALGCPNRVYYKSEDKMKIHLPSSQRIRNASQHADYFYNYFTLGLDVLFDGETNRTKKVILHTNYPGHYDFNIYFRCNFQMVLEGEQCFETTTQSSSGGMKSVAVTPFTKWEEISDFVLEPSMGPNVVDLWYTTPITSPSSPPQSRMNIDSSPLSTPSTAVMQHQPVILNRAGSNNATNPFGSTFCFGYQDMIFEVMANNYIASLTLFDVVAVGQEQQGHVSNAVPSGLL